jgi:hypothetical protein
VFLTASKWGIKQQSLTHFILNLIVLCIFQDNVIVELTVQLVVPLDHILIITYVRPVLKDTQGEHTNHYTTDANKIRIKGEGLLCF